jgi:hypothetical protein
MVRHSKDAKAAPEADRALHQADLSHLRLQDMTASERAELKRRYAHFVRHFRATGAATGSATAKPRRVRKWTPKRSGPAS